MNHLQNPFYINDFANVQSDAVSALLIRATNLLGQFLSHRETNLRYLALESMAQLAGCEFSRDAVKKHLDTVSTFLMTYRYCIDRVFARPAKISEIETPQYF